jgi:hypothetical protein
MRSVIAGAVAVGALVLAGCGGSGSEDAEGPDEVTTTTAPLPSEAELCFGELSAFLETWADDDGFYMEAMAQWGRSDPRTQAVQNGYMELNRQLYEVGRDRAWQAAYGVLSDECEAIAGTGTDVAATAPDTVPPTTADPAVPDPGYDPETPTTLPGNQTNGIDLDAVRAEAAALIVETYGNPADASGVDCSDPAYPPEARIPGQTFVCAIETQDFTVATVVVRIIEGGDFTVAVLDPPHGGD